MRKTMCVLGSLLLATATSARAKDKKPKPQKSPPAAAAVAPAVPAAQLVGVSVLGPGFGKDRDEIRPFGERPGTTLTLAVTIPPPGGILAIDGDAESLQMDGGSGPMESPELSGSTDLAASGQGGTVSLRSSALPGADAISVTAKGTLKVLTSPGVRTEKVPSVTLEKDASFRLGGGSVTVSDAAVTDEAVRVTFAGPFAVVKAIKAVRFRAGSAAAVEGEPHGWGTIGDETAMVDYAFPTKATAGSLEVDVWQGAHEVQLPFDVEAGVGLPRPPAAMAAIAPEGLAPLPPGTAVGQMMVDGKTVSLTSAVAVSGPDTFDETKEAYTVILSEKPLPADTIEKAELKSLDSIVPQGLVITVRQDGQTQGYRMVIRHPLAGEGLQQSSGLFSKDHWRPLGPDRVAGRMKSSGDGPEEMLGHKIQYGVRFDAPVARRFPLEVPLVLAPGATRLPLGGGAPGKAWLQSECSPIPVDAKDPKSVEAFLTKEGKMPTDADLAQMSKEKGQPVTREDAMKMFAAMVELASAFRPKGCKVLGGSQDGKLAILKVRADVMGGPSEADAYMVKEGDAWKLKKTGTWSSVK